MSKLKITCTPNETKRTFIVKLQDLGYTEKEWLKLSQEQQESIIQTHLDDLPEQPYWVASGVALSE